MGMAKPTPALVPVGVKMAVFCAADVAHSRVASVTQQAGLGLALSALQHAGQHSSSRCRLNSKVPYAWRLYCSPPHTRAAQCVTVTRLTHHPNQAPAAVQQGPSTVTCNMTRVAQNCPSQHTSPQDHTSALGQLSATADMADM